jgi:glutathione S-transferase
MYKLYNVKAWGSVCVHFLLEEMEVPYTNIWMTADQVRTEEFRSISPLGYVPALGLQDGRTLFESAAIVTFLLTAHPDKALSPPPGSDDFGEFLSWLHYLSANLYPAINLTYPGSGYAMTAEQDAHLVATATVKCNGLWAIVEERLAQQGPWMMGDSFSALDIYTFMLTLWSKPNETALQGMFPHVARLAQELRARPKLKAALEAHGIFEVGGYGG